MSDFGQKLRFFRRNGQDPDRGGVLTQARFGELIGHYLDDMGYTGGAISNWERGTSSPSHQERQVLLALLHVLQQTGGLTSREQADDLLAAGQYMALSETEASALNAAWGSEAVMSTPPALTATPPDWSRLRRFLPVDLFQQVEIAPREQQQTLCLPHLQQLLATIITYVPRHQARTLLTNPLPPMAQSSGAFLEGTLLFADISGFTELSERLRQMGGKEGAEKIVEIVNQYLDTMLAILFGHNGQLIKFGGDAMLCLFAGESDGAMNALWAAWEMNQAMTTHFDQIEVFQELFDLNMKVGNSSGLLFAATVGDDTHLEYMLTGSAVERTAQAEAAAHRGEIIISQDTYAQVADQVQAEPLPDQAGLYRMTAVPTPPTRTSQDSWTAVTHHIYSQTTDVWQVVTWLEALAPYLPVGLLPQLVYDPRAEHLESQHRRVTVLFANFTGMSRVVKAFGTERSEEITAVLQEYFQAMQEEVHYYGGVTNKVDLYDQGDKLMVLFGAPIAHERDARRAALTALAMQKRMSQLASPLASVFLSQRIGLHTGFVFAGNVGSVSQHRREYTVMGNTVNLAARLMSAAAEDEIWISETMWEQVRGEFRAEALSPIQAKGFAELVTPYRLESFFVGEERPYHHLHAPLIGRHQELTKLQARTDEMLYGGGKQIVAITGEGGVGKSRLVQSWQESVGSEPYPVSSEAPLWLTAEAKSYGQPTYGLFLQMIRELVGITATDPQAVCWRKLDRYLGQQLVGSDAYIADALLQQEAYLGSFLGLDLSFRQGTAERIRQLEGEALQLQIWLAVTELLAGTARQRPLLLILEDLHWADEASLALLRFVIDRLPDTTPILFCLVYRVRKEQPIWQTWQEIQREHPDCEELALAELDGASRASLLHQLLDLERPLDPTFEQLVLAETDGNPLYLEEVLYRLMADGILVKADSGWQLTQPVIELVVPDTLYQMIQSRIDDLDYASPGVRRVLWLAAVSGYTFASEGLEHLFLNTGRDQAEFQRHFRLLRNAAMFERAQVRLGEGTRVGFQFRHGLVQQVAYENMPVSHRRQYHQQVGEWLESTYSTAVTAHYETIAHHFAQGQVWAKAFYYYFLAGQRDARAYANDTAWRYLWLALSLTEEAKPDALLLAKVHFEFGKLLAVTGEGEEARLHLDKANVLLSPMDETTAVLLRARICYEIGRLYERAGGAENLAEALQQQQAGLAMLTVVLPEPTTEAAMLQALAGIIHVRAGRFAEADAACEQSLTLAEATRDQWTVGFVHRLLSVSQRHQGQPATAMGHIQQAIAINEMLGDLISLGKDYANQGVFAFEMGDWALAEKAYLQAIEVLEQIGGRYHEAMARCNLADLHYHQGDIEAGFRQAEQGLALFEQAASYQGIIFALIVLATLHSRQQAYTEMEATLSRAQQLIDEHTVAEFQPILGRWLAELYLAQGEIAQAQQEVERLLALDTAVLGLEAEPVQRVQAAILAYNGQTQEALSLLQTILLRLQADEDHYQIGVTHLALAQLYIQLGETNLANVHGNQAMILFTMLGATIEMTATADLLTTLA